MQKAIIHYFSGTGNSLLAARTLAKGLTEYDITYHAIEKGKPDHIDLYQLHIFFFPVYATSVPHIMRKYIAGLSRGKGTKAAVISTNANVSTQSRDGYQGWALHQARLCLKKRGYDVFFSDTLDFPHNLTIVFPPTKDSTNQILIRKATEAILPIAEKISAGITYHRGFFYPNIIWSIPFGILYTVIGRRLFGKLFAADGSCNKCGLCAQQCPAKVIKVKNKRLSWGWSCEGCMRCMNICPKSSIQTSTVRLLLVIVATVANPLYYLYKKYLLEYVMELGNISTAVISGIIWLLLLMLFTGILDLALYYLSYIPVIRKILGFGHTKFLGRYHAKKYETR